MTSVISSKTIKRYPIFTMTGIVLLSFFVLSKVIVLPDLLSSILALGWILYVPFTWGNLLCRLPIKSVNAVYAKIQDLKFANAPIKWFMGIIIIVCLTYIFLVLNIRVADLLGPILLTVPITSQLIRPEKTNANITKKQITILLLMILLGLSYAAYVRSFSPYPLTPGIDIYSHMYVIKNILLHNSTLSPLIYFPTLDVMIALGSNTFHADLMEVFWLGPFLLFSLFSSSLFIMSYWITKNFIQSMIATFIGVSVTEMGLISNLQFLFPSSFVMSIFPITFYIIDSLWNTYKINKKFASGLTLLVFVGMALIHLEVGVVGALMISTYLITHHYVKRKNLINFMIRITTIYISIVLLLYYWKYFASQIHVPTLFYREDYSYTISTKIMHLQQFYTDIVMIFALFGIMVLSLYRDRRALVIGFISAIILLLYFQDINFIHRVLTLERPLLVISAAALLVVPLNILELPIKKILKSLKREYNYKEGTIFKNKIKHLTEKYKKSKHIEHLSYSKISSTKSLYDVLDIITSTKITKTSIIYATLVLIFLFPILMQPYEIYLAPFFTQGFAFANVTYDELETGKWIGKNTPTDYVIYSDPLTVIEFRGLTDLRNMENIITPAVQDHVRYALSSTDAQFAYDSITSSVGKKTIIIITPRTSVWLEDPNPGAVQLPHDKFNKFQGFEKFFDTKYFTLEYQSKNIFVFTPNEHL